MLKYSEHESLFTLLAIMHFVYIFLLSILPGKFDCMLSVFFCNFTLFYLMVVLQGRCC